MNKSLLIIVCDFLLISLLSMASFNRDPSIPKGTLIQKDHTQSAEDVLDALRIALETEQSEQAVLSQELSNVKGNLLETQSILQTKEESLEKTRADLSSAKDRVEALEAREDRLEKDLTNTSQRAAVSHAKFEIAESELIHRRQESSQMNQKIDALQKEKFELALDLKESQTEAIVVREQLAATRDDFRVARSDVAFSRQELLHARSEITQARMETEIERDEKKAIQKHAERLASEVSSLAEKSEEIKDEIRSSTPLSANRIFDEFRNNQIDTHFHASKSGLFGRKVNRKKSTKGILASDGARYYILYHIEDTPFSLLNPDAQWERLTGEVRRHEVSYSIPILSGLAMDPRILVVHVGLQQAEHLGCKIYPFSKDPYKFEEAVLIGADEDYFGEVAFALDPKHPGYVKMDRSSLGKLFGRFSPSRGDLVFSKTGELLGIMTNTKYCAVFREIQMKQRLVLGIEVDEKETARALVQMRMQFQNLPFSLQ